MSRSVKLIVVVRDPTRRAISDYTQSLAKKPDNYPFETFAVKDLDKEIVNENWMKLKIGLYGKFLEKWLEYFPLSQLHFVSGEELIKDPAKEVKLVEKFLDLKPFITDDNFQFNETKGFHCIIGKRTAAGIQTKPHCMGKSKGRTHPAVPGAVTKLLHKYFRPHNLDFYKMVKRDFGWP
jgi:[heparan sulfate]-glucosamine 3-sulfotransferase 3